MARDKIGLFLGIAATLKGVYGSDMSISRKAEYDHDVVLDQILHMEEQAEALKHSIKEHSLSSTFTQIAKDLEL